VSLNKLLEKLLLC